MLFIEEAPLAEPILGSSGFAEKFSKRGPLHELDLKTRLFKVPCSYMIQTEAFDGMGADALDAVYRRLHQVLSGQAKDPKYAKLTLADRRNILKVLQNTKKTLPEYLKNASI
jgi:hypothetical protein